MRKLLFLFMALIASQAMARLFPSNARFGEVSSVTSTQIVIDSKTFSPAPGLKVHSKNNTLIFLRQLPVGTLVGYQIDARSQLFQVWVLTADEAKQKGLTTSVAVSSD